MRFSEYQVVATTLSNLYENNYYEPLCEKYNYDDIMVRDEHQTCCYSSDAYKGYCYFHIDEYKDKNGNKLSKEAKKVIKNKVYRQELYERIKYMSLILYFYPIMFFSFTIIKGYEGLAWAIFGMFLVTFLSFIPFGILTGKHYDKV